jgi:hypothetical protein
VGYFRPQQCLGVSRASVIRLLRAENVLNVLSIPRGAACRGLGLLNRFG